MPDELDDALAELLEAVARIPARRLPKRRPETGDEKNLPEPVSHPSRAGTTAP
jgi:hypothetical protein